MENRVPTVIVDRSSLFREGLARLLLDSGFGPVTCVSALDEAKSAAVLCSEPVLFLADLGSEPVAAAEFVRVVKKNHPQARVVVLADDFDARHMNAALRAGADGYLMKTIAYDALIKSMELVMLGAPVFPEAIREAMMELGGDPRPNGLEPFRPPRTLSERESQILQCLVRGDANKVIARNLDITESTVKVHIKAILRKIRVKNRTQAAIWAVDHGMALDDGRDGRDEDYSDPMTAVVSGLPFDPESGVSLGHQLNGTSTLADGSRSGASSDFATGRRPTKALPV